MVTGVYYFPFDMAKIFNWLARTASLRKTVYKFACADRLIR